MERRIVGFDFSRGWAISFVVMLHGVVIHGMNGIQSATETVPLYIQLLSLPLIILGSWASCFAVISGASLSYSTFRQILQKKVNLLARFKGSLIRGLVLLMFHFLYILFFINPILDLYNHPQMSIFVGSIRVGHWQVPSYTILFISSALSMLAWTDIAVSLLLFLICRGEGQNRPKRNIVIIILCASLILLISPGLQILLLPLIPQYFSQGNYVMAMLVTWMIGRYQCAFPFVGFGIMGAVVGLMLAYEFPREFFLRIMYGIGLIALVISVLSSIIFGLPNIYNPVQEFEFYMLNLGLQFCVFGYVIDKHDFAPNRKQVAVKTMWMRRWGLVSLTSFLMEGIVANLLLIPFRWIFGDLMKNPIFVIAVFGPVLMTIWIQILIRWQFYDFKYSLEWFLAWIAFRKKGKALEERNHGSNLMHVAEYLYHPIGKTINDQKQIVDLIEK